MRFFLGLILGCVLTVSTAYVVDRAGTTEVGQRTMVNWDVVQQNWSHLAGRARAEWTRLSG